MKVRVLSKNLFDSILPRMRINNLNVEEHLDKAFISINSSDVNSYFDKDYNNVLRVVFDDATPEENEHRKNNGLEPLDLCTIEIGKQIIDFIDKHKNVETFYVHCRAGQSRSGAVGTFINDLYGEETFFQFCNSNPIIKPNYYILALLRRINMNKGIDFEKEVIGLSVKEATNLLKENNHVLRVVSEDGEHFIVTMDLRFDRINVDVNNGIIISANKG